MSRHPSHAGSRLLEEHLDLERKLAEVRQVLEASDANPKAIVRELVLLTRQVLAHFRREEEGGYLAEAVEAAPRFKDVATKLKNQHPEFVHRLDLLESLAAVGDGSARWRQQLTAMYEDFLKRFEEHEHAENRLVQEAFNVDVGAED